MHRYLFFCRIYPKSGKDLARHNSALMTLESAINKSYSEDPPTRDSLYNTLECYKKENEGFVFEIIPIVSDKELEDPKEEAMPEIKNKYPEAELIRFIKVPEYFPSRTKKKLATENLFIH